MPLYGRETIRIGVGDRRNTSPRRCRVLSVILRAWIYRCEPTFVFQPENDIPQSLCTSNGFPEKSCDVCPNGRVPVNIIAWCFRRHDVCVFGSLTRFGHAIVRPRGQCGKDNCLLLTRGDGGVLRRKRRQEHVTGFTPSSTEEQPNSLSDV